MGAKGSSVNQQTLNTTYMIIRQLIADNEEHVANFMAANKAVQDIVLDSTADNESKDAIMNQSKELSQVIEVYNNIMSTVLKFVDGLLASANTVQKRASAAAAAVAERQAASKRSLSKQ